jgi:6-pyruvoyltetrahydropterin/6-carboxytetrahydropterin synthase
MSMGFEISTVRVFSASHQLRLYDGSLETLHGHNWKVKVTVTAEKLDGMGVVMDFHLLEKLVDGVVGPMHNRHLNELRMFEKMNPSAEGVAVRVAEGVKLPGGVRLVSVEVWETAENSAVYRP